MTEQQSHQRRFKSFRVDLDELHCSIFFLFLTGKDHERQVKGAIADLRKNKYEVDDKTEKLLSEVFLDCTRNPGFTFELSDTDVAVCIRPDIACVGTNYFVGLLAHEIIHAIFFIFRSLGLMIDDDEHIAIMELNVLENVLDKIGVKTTFRTK